MNNTAKVLYGLLKLRKVAQAATTIPMDHPDREGRGRMDMPSLPTSAPRAVPPAPTPSDTVSSRQNTINEQIMPDVQKGVASAMGDLERPGMPADFVQRSQRADGMLGQSKALKAQLARYRQQNPGYVQGASSQGNTTTIPLDQPPQLAQR